MYLTVKMLQDHKACQDQVDLFAAAFPDGVQVTEAVCLAVADKFGWDWAAENLLPPEARAEYEAKETTIVAECEARRATIRMEYEAKLTPIWVEYRQQQAALFGRIAETLGD